MDPALLDEIRRVHGAAVADAIANHQAKAWADAKKEQFARGTRYFHGGKPGLAVGDKILPSSVTGAENVMSRYVRGTPGFDELKARCLDHVYFTAARDFAAEYAGVHPDGALYQVVPDGAFEPDPDCGVPGLAWRCRSATIVAVSAEQVLLRRDLTMDQIEQLCGIDSPMGARTIAILRSEGRLQSVAA